MSTFMLCWLAGERYMALFMAGASTAGAVTAMATVVSRSSAMPLAYLPMKLAVAGITANTSALLASAMCSISHGVSRENWSTAQGVSEMDSK